MKTPVLQMFTQTLAIIVLTATMPTAVAQDDAPMMAKQETGQAIGDAIPHDLCEPDGISIGGYDLVSYRQEGGPVNGAEAFSVVHEERHYRFANESNRSTFLADPERYLPAYNGFCAITLALGRITCPEYDNFKIENDRLLLFEVTGFTNGRTLWNSDPDNFRDKADSNYLQLIE